jgi:cytochrome c biogenesis protein
VTVTVSDLSTQPVPVPPSPGRGGPVALARRWWRQLTSMRTALLLLFLLAVASVPGSLLPQRPLNPVKVAEFLDDHTTVGPWLDRFGFFDVFASPWFAAIYLLLAVSLVGCLVPRIRLHARAMRSRPPAAPKHFTRLPAYALPVTAGTAPAVADPAVRSLLLRRRWRTVARSLDDGTVEISAEKGYLRETGNLVFHVALLAVLGGVAAGGLWGWQGNVLLTEGNTFCNTTQGYDQYELGREVDGSSLPPFCVTLDAFHASYLDSGQPSSYAADVRYGVGDAAPTERARIEVNEPLRIAGGSRVYLIDHGYAPILEYTDRYGQKFSSPNAFLPSDGNLSSDGVAVFADANQKPGAAGRTRGVEVAFEGVYTPTAPESGPRVRSLFPAERSPGITLAAYRGDTGLGSGMPRSVYSLDQNQIQSGALKNVGAKFMRPGETWTLDDGSTLKFVGTKQWAGLRVDSDPAQNVVLVASVAMMLGLIGSLTVRRRRLWVRLAPAESGGTVVTVGGLARTDADSYAEEFSRTATEIARTTGASPAGTAPATANGSGDRTTDGSTDRTANGSTGPADRTANGSTDESTDRTAPGPVRGAEDRDA